MARAGRMRPNTMSPGILTTPRVRPESKITLRTKLVDRPENACQYPGTHQRTGCSVLVTLAMCPPIRALAGAVHQQTKREAGRDPSPGAGELSSCVTHSPEPQPSGLRTGRGGPTPPESSPAPGATRPGRTCGPREMVQATLRGPALRSTRRPGPPDATRPVARASRV